MTGPDGGTESAETTEATEAPRPPLFAIKGDASTEEVATFVGMFDSMREGFGGTWDRLEAYLAQERAAA